MARLWYWLSTLRSAAHTAPRKTRFRLLAKLYRVGLATHKAPPKGFRGTRYISSPFPKLVLAQCQCIFLFCCPKKCADINSPQVLMRFELAAEAHSQAVTAKPMPAKEEFTDEHAIHGKQ
jgi:hypothetical protein